MNLLLLTLVPRLMGLSDKIMAIVSGKASPGDYRAVASELYDLLKAVPQLQGLLILVEPLLKIVLAVGNDLFNDPQAAAKYGLTDEEIRQGKAVAELLGPLYAQMAVELKAAAANVQPGDVPKLTGGL